MHEVLRSQRFQKLLYGILLENPEGFSEFNLLEVLREREVPGFVPTNLDDSFQLFQTHFLLFHHLYRLRESLRADHRGDVNIHCLKIELCPWLEPMGSLPALPDPLREYYLDLRVLETTGRSQVEDLLNGFWEQYQHWENRPQALMTLGLSAQANFEEIRARFCALALEHHPDHGGNPERFREIHDAARSLLKSSDA